MADLQSAQARICYTAAGYLILNGKVLLIKHKKLGFWLAPGGHVEEGELPHHAAEREFWEETGIRVKAVEYWQQPPAMTSSELLPNPALTNLHWISEENYQLRLTSSHPELPHATQKWPKGCEQHVCLLYFVAPLAGTEYTQNLEETDGIGWFDANEVPQLATTDDLKAEIHWLLRLAKRQNIG